MAENWQQIEHEVLGDFDPTFLVNAAAEAGKGIMTEVQKAEAAKKQSADDDTKSKAAIAADRAATAACVEVAVAQKGSNADITAARQAVAQQALTAQASAGVGLSTNAQAVRVKAANGDAQAAAEALSKAPTDARAAAKAKCAAETAQRVQFAAVSAGVSPAAAKEADKPRSISFFKKMAGPLPVWGWGLVIGGVGGALAGLALVLRRRKK